MPSHQSLSNRYEQHLQSFYDHISDINQLHHQLIQNILPQLIQSLNLSPISIELVTRFLDDRINLFRFLNRNKFDIQISISALKSCIEWRLESNLGLISPNSLDPIYLQAPLLFFHDQLKDKWGRSCAILNLKYLTRTQDGNLDGLKEFIAWTWELARRSMYEFDPELIHKICSSNPHPSSSSPPFSSSFTHSPSSSPPAPNIPVSLQVSLIVDLKDASMSNLELELIPYLVHLLKHNFPDMVGAIFILNYGWMYAGMWQVVKRILTQPTLDRIVFPSQEELFEFFDRSNLLVEHGGLVDHRHGAQQNQFMSRFGKPAHDLSSNQLSSIATISRHPSAESIHDIFFSAVNTPYHPPSHPGTPNRNFSYSHRKPSWLNMTSYYSSSHISSSSINEALKRHQSKPSHQIWLKRSPSDFQLKLPSRALEDHEEETSEGSTAARLTSGHLSSYSSSSSLPETIKQPLLSNQPEENPIRNSQHPVPKKNKRDYFCIKLIIKFGYFLRTLQMLFRILATKLINHQRPSAIDDREEESINDSDYRRNELRHLNRSRNEDDVHRRQLFLHHLFILLNLQRKKMMSSLGLLIFLLFLKRKKA